MLLRTTVLCMERVPMTKLGSTVAMDDPNGKLDITRTAGYWLQDAASRGIQHICWGWLHVP